jgi:hypothetical protein
VTSRGRVVTSIGLNLTSGGQKPISGDAERNLQRCGAKIPEVTFGPVRSWVRISIISNFGTESVGIECMRNFLENVKIYGLRNNYFGAFVRFRDFARTLIS